jgi:hypothetical protein
LSPAAPILVGFAGALALPAWAASTPASPPTTLALRVAEPPVVDGDVLGDPSWAAAAPITGFWQTTPDEGQPASERTEVRLAYTPEALYVGVVCYDREPEKIVVAGSRRDSPLDDTDSFQIVLDTYRDGQNGFVFGTNPAGLEYDGQVTNEGQGGERGQALQQTTAGGGFNLNWDASWTVRTRTGEFGWSAEFAIPFRTIRYARGGPQAWGVNFQRTIPRRKESAFWSPLPRQFTIHRVSAAGVLQGLEAPSQRNLKLAPYLLGEVRREVGARSSRTDADLGGDLKYSLTPSLTLDATVNTDFAQVEVDEEQINLDRFSLFFPEKRPFFLENAGVFAVGVSGELELFFSRRIGISPDGGVVPILGGGRVSGKLLGMNVGLLDMQTRAAGSVPATNFGVLRLSRDLPSRSMVGVLYLNRRATGESAGRRDVNRTYAVDGRWGIGRYGQLAGFLAKTTTPGIERDDTALHVALTRNSPAWETFVKYTEVGRGFNPEVGFTRRTGYRKPEALVFHRHRPRAFLGLHEIRPHVSYRGFWKPDGFQETGYLHCDSHWEWRSGHEIHTGINFTREGLRQPFEIHPGVVVPPGTYDHRELQLVARSRQAAPVSFDGTFVIGGFFGGHRAALRPSVKLRRGETLGLEVKWDRNDVDLPGGRFVTNLLRIRTSYSFSPRVFVQALVQYNDRFDRWSTNLRLGWLQTANTGLFLVYNETRDTGGFAMRDRSLILKLSRLVDLLD